MSQFNKNIRNFTICTKKTDILLDQLKLPVFYHLCGNLASISDVCISDPWTMQWSKSKGRKYFFNLCNGESKFDCPVDSIASVKYVLFAFVLDDKLIYVRNRTLYMYSPEVQIWSKQY